MLTGWLLVHASRLVYKVETDTRVWPVQSILVVWAAAVPICFTVGDVGNTEVVRTIRSVKRGVS
jgi:bacteriorhodopsin